MKNKFRSELKIFKSHKVTFPKLKKKLRTLEKGLKKNRKKTRLYRKRADKSQNDQGRVIAKLRYTIVNH